MITEPFNVNSTRLDTLFGPEDIEPVTIIRGSSPLVLTFPHNATRVPSNLHPTLNMPHEWFKSAHESHDLHMDEMCDLMQKRFPDATFVIGNYSRLVADTDRVANFCIEPNSTENEKIAIIGNNPPYCDTHQRALRVREIWDPYQTALNQVIHDVRMAHNGIIKLDMHSFSPTWRDAHGNTIERNVQIGTLRAQTSPFACIFENFIKQHGQYKFISGEPYSVVERKDKNATCAFKEKYDLQCLGLEIRNDLIATLEQREEMLNFVASGIENIFALPDKDLRVVMDKASTAINHLGSGIFRKCCGSDFKSLVKKEQESSITQPYEGFDPMI